MKERLEQFSAKLKTELEEIMTSAAIMPSNAKNIGLGGRGEKAFKNYVAKNKKNPGKSGIVKYPTPKFKDLLK